MLFSWVEVLKKRERKGLPAVPKKEPEKKKAKTATNAKEKEKEREKKKKEEEKYDVSDIALEGEDKDEVPIYDTCDYVRKKIHARSRHVGYTGAAFCPHDEHDV